MLLAAVSVLNDDSTAQKFAVVVNLNDCRANCSTLVFIDHAAKQCLLNLAMKITAWRLRVEQGTSARLK